MISTPFSSLPLQRGVLCSSNTLSFSRSLVSEGISLFCPFLLRTSQELKALIHSNAVGFSIQRIQSINTWTEANLEKAASNVTDINQRIILQLKAIFEELIRKHFGNEVVNHLFD
ncbi:hypothetical protein SLE2022_188520 [Rubroshorea leprosula]